MMSPQDSTETITRNGDKDSDAAPTDSNEVNDTVADSLGVALAGMTLTAPSQASSAFGSSAVSGAPFALAPGGSQNEMDGWGNFSDPSPGVFSGAGSIPASPGRASVQTSAIEALRGNESLELFLSKSPSQTLGDDVFKLSHQNLPSLEEEQRNPSDAFRFSTRSLAPGPTSSHSFGEIRPQDNGRRRNDSPSCSVTGTTTVTSSRSASPYANNSDIGGQGRTIQAYQRFESAPSISDVSHRNTYVEDDRSNSGYSLSHGHGSHPSLVSMDSNHRSPYGKDRNQIKSNLAVGTYDQGFDRSFSQPLYGNGLNSQANGFNATQSSSESSQAQVLYMAVPSPDGRGQVLQPVQMVQMPGKPFTFVVPGAGGSTFQGQVTDASQQSLSLPPLKSNSLSDYGSLNGVSPGDYGGAADVRSRLPTYSVDLQYDPAGRNDVGGAGRISLDQYQTDPAVASLYATPQRPPLDALLGQVRRLSRDQVGCRLVQQALDEEGPMAATLILNEGLPFWGEAMVDPFGNYLFQKILEKITIDERVMLIKSVSSRLVNASLNLHGTRSVQKIVELCAQDEQAGTSEGVVESASDILVKSLAPAAARLCIDSHGNHVIQRILLKLGHMHSRFVFDAVANSVGDVARHRHGCCVIQRCLDSPPSDARSHLVRRIVEKSLELMQDAYGNYVVQYVLDVCSDEDVQAVCESVVGKVNLLAIQKFSSNVMEKCLERCSDRVKEMYLQEMSDPERIRELMMDPFGNYVVQRALSVATHAQAVALVEAMRPHLVASQIGGPTGQRNGGVRNTAGGRRIIAKICRRFPNFNLNTVGSPAEMYSQNKGAHNRHQSPMFATYRAPVGAPAHSPHYQSDPRMAPGHMAVQQQQQPYYNIGGNPYFDQFTGSYPGM